MPNVQDQPRAGMGIHELVVEAHQDVSKDRRAEPRYPFFRQLKWHAAAASGVIFSREISTIGIGLFHNVPLEPGEIEVSIPSRRGYSIHTRIKVLWCQPCGEGWYLSGGQFAGKATVEQ